MIYNNDYIDLKSIKSFEVCVVNADNEFKFMDKTFKISKEMTEYTVYNKYDEVYDYTNESFMSKVTVVINKDNLMTFYDEHNNQIRDDFIRKICIEGELN